MSKEDIRINHSCISCTRPIDSRDLASMQCGHPYHYQCLQVSLGEQIKKQVYPVCCPIPKCCIEPSMYFMSVVLEESDFKNYLILEKNNIQTFQNYECPFCDQTFLAYPSNKFHKCLKCYKVLCLTCHQLAHPGKQCQQAFSTDNKIQLPQIISPIPFKKQMTDITNNSNRSISIFKKQDNEQPSHSSNETNEGMELSSCVISANKASSLRKHNAISVYNSSAAPSSSISRKNSIVNSKQGIQSNVSPIKQQQSRVSSQKRQDGKDFRSILRENSNSRIQDNIRKSHEKLQLHIMSNRDNNLNKSSLIRSINSANKHSNIQYKYSC